MSQPAMPGPNREPYQLGPSSGPPVVLLHGLTGSPYDLRPVADALARAGYRVHAPRLAGHSCIERLSEASWQDWYDSAEEALVQAKRSHGRALLMGFSLGSLLALRLAAKQPESLAGLVLIGVPIEQPRWQLHTARLLSALRRRSPLLARAIGYYPRRRSDARTERMASGLKGFPGMPYESIAQLCALQAEVWPLLARVRAPTLMLHGAYDHSAPVAGSARVSQALASTQLRRVVLPDSYHHVARDLDAERTCTEVVDFATRLLPSSTTLHHGDRILF